MRLPGGIRSSRRGDVPFAPTGGEWRTEEQGPVLRGELECRGAIDRPHVEPHCHRSPVGRALRAGPSPSASCSTSSRQRSPAGLRSSCTGPPRPIPSAPRPGKPAADVRADRRSREEDEDDAHVVGFASDDVMLEVGTAAGDSGLLTAPRAPSARSSRRVSRPPGVRAQRSCVAVCLLSPVSHDVPVDGVGRP
jgi:hypothetical protein